MAEKLLHEHGCKSEYPAPGLIEMQATLIAWWLVLSYSCIVFATEVDWNKLKKDLDASENELAAIKVVENWDKRPLDFFLNLGEDLWFEISRYLSPSQINKIQHKEFDLMAPELLRDILYQNKVCPTTDISFWTGERIEHASSECLHRILAENKVPVKLGNLWRKVNWLAVHYFTNEMWLSLQNIDYSDYYFMPPDVLKVILPFVPKACSALGPSFWTKKTIKGISGDCLHELLAKNEIPIKLGGLWRDVSVSCYNLLERPDFSLDSVHPDDRLLAGDWVGRVIRSRPLICQTLAVSFWNEETVNYMTKGCLDHVTDKTKRPVALGGLWNHISTPVLEEFVRSMYDRLVNIAASDFQYMPLILLQSIFSSELAPSYLPQPRSEIILSPQASEVSIGSLQFAKLARLAPSVAGQLLWYSTKLPEDILSYCEGNDIRSLSLAIPGEGELDWKGLFAKLEGKYSLDGRAEFFGQMVQSISENATLHFCATLLDPEEYFSLTWLHHNLSDKRRKALPFDPEHVSRLFSTLDLSGEYYWQKMLAEYSSADWTLLSQSKRVAALLRRDCKFWSTIESGGWLNVFMALDSLMLKSILPECVLKIPGILKSNPDKIPLLADDAFSKHVAGQLPCRLNSLSPNQIGFLSSKNFKNIFKVTDKEISQHVLSGMVLDDFKTLNLQQFRTLYESQWSFVPDRVKGEALSWQLEAAQRQALNFVANLNTGQQTDNFKVIEDTLSLVLEAYKDGYRNISEPRLASLITFIKGPDRLKSFIRAFEESSILKPAAICLVCNVKELQDYNRKAFEEMGAEKARLVISHSRQFGFDRSAIIKLLEMTPELFAALQARVDGQGILDGGGVIRALTDQLLSDIQRDLVVPLTEDPSLESEFAQKVRIDDGLSPQENTVSGDGKFVWGISREAGLIVGLALGKALQLEISLPFSLSQMFYRLLIDTSDKTITQYYLDTYRQEIARFRQGIIDLSAMEKFEEPLHILTRPDSLRFTKLSTAADAQEAKRDLATRTNLWGCSDGDCYTNIKELEARGFVENYIENILEKVQAEFREFIHELVRGLGIALPPVENFSSLPLPILRPFAEFLPKLLNAAPVNERDVLDRVEFDRDHQVPSLVEGQTVSASAVFSAFVQSLEEKRLKHLIGIWTGASTFLVRQSKLRVTFKQPYETESYKVNFCDHVSPTKYRNDGFIAPGEEYLAFFKRFSHNLLGPGINVEPDCGPEGIGIIPGTAMICAKELGIYVQSAEEMLNSLVDLLRTSLTTLG